MLLDAKEAQVTRRGTSQRSASSVLGETVASAPRERRNYPGSHADLAGCGGEIEWDIPEVGCCKLIGKEGEGSQRVLRVVRGKRGPRCSLLPQGVADG